VLIGGGRDNHVIGNVFVGAGSAVLVDNRGMGYQKGYWSEANGEIRQKLDALPWNREPYLSRYPELARVLVDQPGAPVGTRITGNLAVGQTIGVATDAVRPFVEIDKNYALSEGQAGHLADALDRIGIAAIGNPAFYGDNPKIKRIVDGINAADIGLRCHRTIKACMAVE
jgi:hypothetical protein